MEIDIHKHTFLWNIQENVAKVFEIDSQEENSLMKSTSMFTYLPHCHMDDEMNKKLTQQLCKIFSFDLAGVEQPLTRIPQKFLSMSVYTGRKEHMLSEIDSEMH